MRKLLIADSNPDLAYAMQRLLSFYDFSVRVVKNSKSLLTEMNSYKPDIILIDVSLVEDDGRIICKSLREDPANRNIALILFSGSAQPLIDFKNYGADGAIVKPFNITDLVNQIKFAQLNRKEALSEFNKI